MSHCDYIDDLDSRQRFLLLLGFTLADLECNRRSCKEVGIRFGIELFSTIHQGHPPIAVPIYSNSLATRMYCSIKE